MENIIQENPTEQIVPLVSALIAANTAPYNRLTVRLQEFMDALSTGDNKVIALAYEMLNKILTNYRPIDPKMDEFLVQFRKINSNLILNLQQIMQSIIPDINTDPKNVSKKPRATVEKQGLYRYPFYAFEKLDVGNISDYPTIYQTMNVSGTHFKLWKNINNVPFIVNGHDAYSCTTKVLASQAGKLLNLQCEEVFFGNLDGKRITVTAFHEAVTLLENTSFELYPMSENYLYQSQQKQAFYFLIQNWPAYSVIRGEVKERFERHYIDSNGNIFLSQHENATFLTPHQMSNALLVRFSLTQENYAAIRDLIVRIGDKDLADIVFSSIPVYMIEEHDEIANNYNKPTFDMRRQAFDSNWTNLKEAFEQFDNNLKL